MYVMQGVLSASTTQNNPQVIESVSRALGQIYTKGKLMNEEMRQLAEAGIPAYQILQEKLGLTSKQLSRIGDAAIPADKAINALVDGMNERFGGVLDASTQTMSGIVSNMKDNATMLSAGIFEPLYNRIKGVVAKIGNSMASLREAFDLGGIGAVFEKLVPPELQSTIRTLIANLMTWYRVVAQLNAVIFSAFKPALLGIVQALNALLPILNAVMYVFAAALNAIVSCQPVMRVLTAILISAATAWLMFKIQALGALMLKPIIAVVNGISKALLFLSAVLVKNPIFTIFTLASAALIGFAVASKSADNSITGLFKKLAGFGGVDPDKVLLPSQKESK